MTTAGCRTVELSDDGVSFPALVLYPSTAPEHSVQLGRFEINAASEGPLANGAFPLVVISHGSGGSHLLYRGLAAHLARSGFVVVLPEHPRNNRNNNELAGTHTILADRPRQLRLAIDGAYADPDLGPHLAPEQVAVIGHSLGGYTALALAGGKPWAAPHETPNRLPLPVPVTPDPRVKAVVLLAPATPWFQAPQGLEAVRVPIQIWSGEKDPITPGWHAEIVKRGVAPGTSVDHRLVPNAGHFSFLAPFPDALTRPDFAPSQDPPGFDRPRFHAELNTEVTAFLQRWLG